MKSECVKIDTDGLSEYQQSIEDVVSIDIPCANIDDPLKTEESCSVEDIDADIQEMTDDTEDGDAILETE